MCVTDVRTFDASLSCSAVTVTVFGPRSVAVNTSSAGATVTLACPEVGVTVTDPLGAVSSATVYVSLPPSASSSRLSDTVTPRTSLSSMVSSTGSAVAVTPPVALAATEIVSLPSSSVSSTGVTVTACSADDACASMVSVNDAGEAV